MPNLVFNEEYWDVTKEPSPFSYEPKLYSRIGILEQITALNFLKTVRVERDLKSHYHTKL